MEEFALNAKIYIGRDACDVINRLESGRAFIFCDPYMMKSGKTSLITEKLNKSGSEYQIFSEIVPDPDLTVIRKGILQMEQFRPDIVFAIGGGSAIDTAKAAVHLYAKIHGSDRPELVAVPTTSGTGSEVTSFAVISDREAGSKYPLIDDKMIPDLVCLDPGLTATVPPSVTADTGIDVFTHALEAYVSTRANDFTDALAEKAMRTVWNYLERCVTDGADMYARTRMHTASCMAGAAFNTASLGLCHSMAHALGARYHLPHGRCNALLLPYIIEYNAGLLLPGDDGCLLRYLDIARVLGISAGDNRGTVHELVRQLRCMMKRIGIPVHFSELKIDGEAYLQSICDMTASALKDRCTATNPRVPSADHIRQIYRKLYQP